MEKTSQKAEINSILTIVLTFFFLTLILGLNRHYSFFSSYDQGIFNQVFWNNTQGNFFQSSLSSQLSTNVVHNGEFPEVNYHRLGQHFTPALLIWLPIYYLFPSAATLTVIMITLVTMAGVVLYVLARQYVVPPVARMITISFYSATAVLGPILCNFHDISQVPLLIFSVLLAMEKRCWWLFAVLCLFILAVREDSAISLFGIGTYMVLSKRYPRIGIAICSFSFLYLIALTNLIMPLFSDDISKRFMLERFGQYAEGNEASTLEIIWGMLKNPWQLIREIFTPLGTTISYLIGQWLPLAFIPALAPASWIIAGFPLLKLFLAQGQTVLALNIRYAMSVVPGLFYGAILWWGGQNFCNFTKPLEELKPKKLTRKFKRFWIFCLTISLLLTFIYSSTELSRAFYFMWPDSFQPWVHVSLTRQWQHAGAIRALLNQIPPDASVSATNNIIPHVSSRREVLRLPLLNLRNDQKEVIRVKYAIADLWELERYQIVFTREKTWYEEITKLIEEVTNSKEYGIIDIKDGVVLLKKGVMSNPDALEQWSLLQKKHKMQ
jgi:uncharacterized membrane protein